MGLASALSTALTGLSAAETTIDVVGNNLANANTVGFKASEANFATQFLQTMSLGSAPSDNSGGTNPRQTGLGTMVAEITPDFKQGTIQISSSPTDLAIQGEGFYMLQGASNDLLYSRNGIFKLNAENQMIAITGQRLLGFGVSSDFQIDESTLKPIAIPLGSTAVAQATKNVYLQGQLSPTGDIADTAEQIETAALGNAYYTAPTSNATAALAIPPNTSGAHTAGTSQSGGGMTPGATYEYRLVYATQAYAPPLPMPTLSEGAASETVTAAVAAGDGSIQLTDIPNDPVSPGDTYVRIYRREASTGDSYHYVGEVSVGTTTFLDSMSDADAQTEPALDETQISGKYKYYVTFANASGGPGAGIESRVCLDSSPATANVVNGRIVVSDLPTGDTADGWVVRRIYRTLATDDSTYYFVGEVPSVTSDVTLVDNTTDAVLALRPTLDMDGPKILAGTRLTQVLRRDANGYTQLFHEGTLQFAGQKGGRTLATKDFTITASTTVQDLIDFEVEAMGIQSVGSSKTADPGVLVPPGGTVDMDGHIVLTGNNGVDNRIQIDLAGMVMTYNDGTQTVTENVDMRWTEKQAAVGAGAVTDTVVYDSLGTDLPLRVTMVLEKRDSSETTYRWFADSAQNSSTNSAQIAVGTGTVTFDTRGAFKGADQAAVNIHRDGYPAVNPLTFDLDFAQISGLATSKNSLAVSRQDGSAPGVLTSFIVGEDGTITGVFSNGIARTLAQIRLARFANPNGLQQRGQNLFAVGVNSGLPIEGNPGSQGIGSIVAGATELSNTDVGGNLIDLILASTMYRGNARVITTVQQMFDELLALRR